MSYQDLLNRITINPAISSGKATIRGMRYSVDWLVEMLDSGTSIDEILADYEDLEQEDIQAALLYSSRVNQLKRMITALSVCGC